MGKYTSLVLPTPGDLIVAIDSRAVVPRAASIATSDIDLSWHTTSLFFYLRQQLVAPWLNYILATVLPSTHGYNYTATEY